MAESKNAMGRLRRLERDMGEVKQTLASHGQMLTEHGQRLDRVEAAIHHVHRSLNDRIDRLEHRFDSLELSLGSRLDRLIAVTVEERTRNYERLTDIERRLTKLEESH